MRWQRGVLFSAIVLAHVLIVLLFPTGTGPRTVAEPDVFFAALLAPDLRRQQTPENSTRLKLRASDLRRADRLRRPGLRNSSAEADQKHVVPNEVLSDTQSKSAKSIDWMAARLAEEDNVVRQDAEASQKSGALSAWRSGILPPPYVPGASHFRWDYASTHRFESSPLGLNVNLNDRCSVLISVYLMAIIGGCKVGEISVHGDLFTHMRDVDPITQAAH